MGNASSSKDGRFRIVKSDDSIRRYECFCCCDVPMLTCEEESYAFTDNVALRREIFEIICRHIEIRSPRKTVWQRFCRDIETFFIETLPVYCCPPCPQAIIHKTSMQHLNKPTYTFQQFGNNHRVVLLPGSSMYLRFYARRYREYVNHVRGFFLKCGQGRIACAYMSNMCPNGGEDRLTVLYSHNNGIDMGIGIGYAIRIARRYGVNVLIYDYPGFGMSDGPPTEAAVYASIDCVYDFLTTKMRISPDKIVAIGSSLGTAATIHLASRRPVRAVVLQGAFMSALNVVCPFARKITSADRFLNIEKIKAINKPTLFVHGRNDRLFCLRHAKMLRRHCPGAAEIPPLYLPKCGHLGFEDDITYWTRLHVFLHREVIRYGSDDDCCGQQAAVRIYKKRSKVELDETVNVAVETARKKAFALRKPIQWCDRCLEKAEPVFNLKSPPTTIGEVHLGKIGRRKMNTAEHQSKTASSYSRT